MYTMYICTYVHHMYEYRQEYLADDVISNEAIWYWECEVLVGLHYVHVALRHQQTFQSINTCDINMQSWT